MGNRVFRNMMALLNSPTQTSSFLYRKPRNNFAAVPIRNKNAKTTTHAVLGSSVFDISHISMSSEVIQLSDGRLGLLTLPVLIALGWVGFSILGPALNQLDTMSNRQSSKK